MKIELTFHDDTPSVAPSDWDGQETWRYRVTHGGRDYEILVFRLHAGPRIWPVRRWKNRELYFAAVRRRPALPRMVGRDLNAHAEALKVAQEYIALQEQEEI